MPNRPKDLAMQIFLSVCDNFRCFVPSSGLFLKHLAIKTRIIRVPVHLSHGKAFYLCKFPPKFNQDVWQTRREDVTADLFMFASM